jgi:hypothetical protein
MRLQQEMTIYADLPIGQSDRKGGAYQIMLKQFRRAIGVAII